MLVSRRLSVKARIIAIVLIVIGLCLIPLIWYLGAAREYWQRPHASGLFGVTTGILGALIVFFEMLLWPRKWLRGWRLGATRVWMHFHVWLGLACLPMMILHSGFSWGGPLSAWTMVLFLIVIASGVWGLILQQWLPTKMYREITQETIASQVDQAMNLHRAEARSIIDELTAASKEEETKEASRQPVVAGPMAEQIRTFRKEVLDPYLAKGNRSRSLLSSRQRAEKVFQQMRSGLPHSSHPALERLEKLCELRNQWDTLRRYHAWLHNWLLVHVPISLAMTIMMCVHAWQALKFW